jgi:large subunit ribosomal protein L9
MATKENLAKFEADRAELERLAVAKLAAAQERAERLRALTVSITAKVGDEGKLFGSIGTKDLMEAITAAGVAVSKHEVRLPDAGVLRDVGEYMIRLHLHAEVDVEVPVKIVGEA